MKINYERLEKLRISGGYKAKKLAEVAGVSETIISNIKVGKRNLGIDKIKRLADFFGVPVEDLLLPNADHAIAIPVNQRSSMIPVFSPARAGNGELGVSGEIVGEIAITEDERSMGVFALRVSGDSMVDEIFPGEIALFRPVNGVKPEPTDICAVCVESWAECTVKFVTTDPRTGHVILSSKNDKYKPIHVDPTTDRVKILGVFIEARRKRRR